MEDVIVPPIPCTLEEGRMKITGHSEDLSVSVPGATVVMIVQHYRFLKERNVMLDRLVTD